MNKALPERKKRVLCTNVKQIEKLVMEIQATVAYRGLVWNQTEEIWNNIKEIKEQALAMEKRLYLYKETIEALGFKRVRKG